MIELIRDHTKDFTILFAAIAITIVSIVVYVKAKGKRNVLHYLFIACTFTLIFWLFITVLPRISDWLNS